MRNRFSILLTTAVTLCLAITAGSCAADPPASISRIATTAELSPENREDIRAFAEHWAMRLGQSQEDPEQFKRARQKLLEPLTVPGVSALFLDEYSRAMLPTMRESIGGESHWVANNCLILISQLRTERALDELLRWSSARDEDRADIRLTASRGCLHLLRRAGTTMLAAQKISSAARRLKDAALIETDPYALKYQLLAVLAAHNTSNPNLSQGTLRNIRGYLIDAVTGTATRAAEPAGNPENSGVLLEATHAVVYDLLNAYLRWSPDIQREFGMPLGPCLLEILQTPLELWDAAQADASRKTEYLGIIHLSERLLSTAHRVATAEAPPDTQLSRHWEQGSREQYESDLELWRQRLARPPYETR